MSTNAKLANLIRLLATNEGYTQSALHSVVLMRANSSRPRSAVIYEPSIVIIAQGRKRGHIGDRTFVYDPNNYLVLSVPLPFECETTATADEPLLGVSIKIEPAMIAELLLEMNDDSPGSTDVLEGFDATPLNAQLLDVAERLLQCLSSPSEARILGPQIVREIVYRVLCGEKAGVLKALVARRSKFAQIAKSLHRIHSDFSSRLDIETLAKEAGMSVSAFHHNFKVVTSTAPLQYIKSVRLHKARNLMAYEGLSAQDAALGVGYESASQFSREFKRMFGATPAEEADRMRASFASA